MYVNIVWYAYQLIDHVCFTDVVDTEQLTTQSS
jgi:hypothetical protein